MTDQPPHADPFSGDETGSVFDAPDLVLQSPTTNEHFVETQSGFLVVLKRIEERLSLSVKRRLGTPPASSVLLTADESIKLSRILSGNVEGARVPQRTDRWLKSGHPTAYARTGGQADNYFKLGARGIFLPGILTILLLVGIGYLSQSARLPGKRIFVAQIYDPLSAKRLDPFLRQFVSNLLDFNPDSYKVSQVRAMAQMTPELLKSYWQDTHFPLSQPFLKANYRDGAEINITSVMPRRLDNNTASADIFARLINARTKAASPLHLKLKLLVDKEGQVLVSDQKDMTGK